jgi:hypothetical protein
MRSGFGDKVSPLVWYIGNGENCIGWANHETRPAINAFIWMDEELIVALVDALNWAGFDASAVFDADAGLGNHRE